VVAGNALVSAPAFASTQRSFNVVFFGGHCDAHQFEHRAIAQAIVARDPEAAERAMRLHLGAVQRIITERISPLSTAI